MNPIISFRLQDPVWCLLLIPLFIAVLIAVKRQRNSAVLYSSVHVLKTLPKSMALRFKRMLPWMRFLGMALVIVALARPQEGKEEFRIRTEGIAMEMAIDWSSSMVATDFILDNERVTRLEAVKKVFHDFVAGKGDLPGRPDDLIGLIVFGGYAINKCPLTLDHGALLQILKTVIIPEPEIDQYGQIRINRLLPEEGATAIGDAVALGVERLKESKSKSKVLIVLSDGKQTAGIISPEEAAEAAKVYGIKIYAIGVGSMARRIPIRGKDRYGQTQFIQLPGGDFAPDEETMKLLAETTGGRFFHARDTEALTEVYAEIDKLEKTETEGRLYTEYKELFQLALFPGLALILLELLFVTTRFRSLP